VRRESQGGFVNSDEAIFNVCNFLSDEQHCIAESIDLFERFTLGWFHHESSGNRKTDGGRMKT
jgi:hypothetical protein